MKILLINPPIYDFAAYDFWMKPLGLLYLSSILKEKGYEVSLIDATYRQDSFYTYVKSDRFGRGKFNAEEVKKPGVLKDIPRRYRRYGLPRDVIKKRLKDFTPEVVMVTCAMTYWYPGVVEIKEIVDSLDIEPLLLLGGIYPTLLSEHARLLGFDRVHKISDNRISELDVEIPGDFNLYPPPDYSHYEKLEYVVIATSLGCPFSCPYCASPNLYGGKKEKEVGQVVEEIGFLYKKGIRRFALYDDALLIPEERFLALCYGIKKSGFSPDFFTPNGLHCRFLTKSVTKAMQEVGFREPRISLETTDPKLQKRLNLKTTYEEFVQAVDNLTRVGYRKNHIYAYLLAGLPLQSYRSVMKSILDVGKVGVKVSLGEFSPIPGTPMEQSLSDPLLTNNSVYYHYVGKAKEMECAKRLTKWVNDGVDLGISLPRIRDYL